jgi:integrase
MDGRQPFWPENLIKNHVRPAAIRAGITKPVSWHSFRHTLSTWLRQHSEDPKLVQELLRHASVRTTMDVYTHAFLEPKRQAQERVVKKLAGKGLISGKKRLIVPLMFPRAKRGIQLSH